MGKIMPAISASSDTMQFSGPDFDACDVDSRFLARYDEERPMLAIVEGILNKDAAELRAAMLAVAAETGVSVTDLAVDIRTAAKGFRNLSEVFECAADRIEAVGAEPLQ
jgi:hypothetical protein